MTRIRTPEGERTSKTARVIEMACADQGVCAKDVKREFKCDDNCANALIVRAALHGDLVRARSHRGRYHYFLSHPQRDTWVQGEAALLAQVVTLQREQKVARERARYVRRATAMRSAAPAAPAAVPAAEAPPRAEPAPTVYVRSPKDGHVDIMADPLPGVPGWRSGPVIRPGALDYKRHQAAAASTLAGSLR